MAPAGTERVPLRLTTVVSGLLEKKDRVDPAPSATEPLSVQKMRELALLLGWGGVVSVKAYTEPLTPGFSWMEPLLLMLRIPAASAKIPE